MCIQNRNQMKWKWRFPIFSCLWNIDPQCLRCSMLCTSLTSNKLFRVYIFKETYLLLHSPSKCVLSFWKEMCLCALCHVFDNSCSFVLLYVNGGSSVIKSGYHAKRQVTPDIPHKQHQWSDSVWETMSSCESTSAVCRGHVVKTHLRWGCGLTNPRTSCGWFGIICALRKKNYTGSGKKLFALNFVSAAGLECVFYLLKFFVEDVEIICCTFNIFLRLLVGPHTFVHWQTHFEVDYCSQSTTARQISNSNSKPHWNVWLAQLKNFPRWTWIELSWSNSCGSSSTTIITYNLLSRSHSGKFQQCLAIMMAEQHTSTHGEVGASEVSWCMRCFKLGFPTTRQDSILESTVTPSMSVATHDQNLQHAVFGVFVSLEKNSVSNSRKSLKPQGCSVVFSFFINEHRTMKLSLPFLGDLRSLVRFVSFWKKRAKSEWAKSNHL